MPDNMRSIAILGATGSIGTQALDIVARYPDRFRVASLVAGTRADELFALARRFHPRAAGLLEEPACIPDDLKDIEWVFGPDCAVQALKAAPADDALCAIVGIAGLDAVWTALDVCSRVLLANKEALVTGGALVMEKARRLGRDMLPVDSEHSAIFQCLQAAHGVPVAKLILTCSGGALRDWDIARMRTARVEDVLAHPTWNMGAKITVDCATRINKGLEIIEAHHLFSMPLSRIDVVIHPQSIVHSMIEFEDGAVLAQMGHPDMRGPISVAMGFPQRLAHGARPLDLTEVGSLTFEKPDQARFPCMELAREAQRMGGAHPIALNGANEVAVEAFLKREIAFGQICPIIEATLEKTEVCDIRSIEDVHAADEAARRTARSMLRRQPC